MLTKPQCFFFQDANMLDDNDKHPPLDEGLAILCETLGIHNLFQHWLRAYGPITTALVGCSSAGNELDSKGVCDCHAE